MVLSHGEGAEEAGAELRSESILDVERVDPVSGQGDGERVGQSDGRLGELRRGQGEGEAV